MTLVVVTLALGLGIILLVLDSAVVVVIPSLIIIAERTVIVAVPLDQSKIIKERNDWTKELG